MKKISFIPLIILMFLPHVSATETKECTNGYIIKFRPGFEQDAEYIEKSINNALACFEKAFKEWTPTEKIRNANLEVILHPEANFLAGPGRTEIHTETKDGVYHARLHLFPPSLITPGHRTSMNEPMGKDYYDRLMIHELFSIIADKVTRNKESGWHIYEAPDWFVQGLEQYVALSISDSEETLRKYIIRTKKNETISQTDSGLAVSNPYTCGTALLAYLCRNGNNTIKQLLMSNDPSFEEAIQRHTGMNTKVFLTKFNEWIDKQ
ncbi:MAG: hypothetical protein O7C75_00975 [Verrucomicrobia bacterium]|nr:hypothetical protein [Verrucomicrobiota bacterium]